jgi:predicted Rossmann fold flavoprotein
MHHPSLPPARSPTTAHDVVIVGAGAAGLFAAIHAGRTARTRGIPVSIAAVDGARKLGAKILVAGGGRCNVTHWKVTEGDFAGSTPPAIRRVLARFDADAAVAFFREAGVELKREETGKLFPVTDSARTVLEALLREAIDAGAALLHPARVTSIEKTTDGFHIVIDETAIDNTAAEARSLTARRVILATGGKSLPKSGSDGLGLELAKRLGHSVTSPVVPALVPIVLESGHWITSLSGLTLPAEIVLVSPTGKRLQSCTGSTLCTHFGLSGPAVLDISRHWLVARDAEPRVKLTMNWLPGIPPEVFDRMLLDAAPRPAVAVLRDHLPDRLARALCDVAGATAGDLTREARRRLVQAATATPLPVVGDRGFAIAEATAGGVPLSEVRLETMESRLCPGLHFAGEVLDVDGRIGGFNFQWAWASGFVAGSSATASFAGGEKVIS